MAGGMAAKLKPEVYSASGSEKPEAALKAGSLAAFIMPKAG